jgi:hypothetical protein
MQVNYNQRDKLFRSLEVVEEEAKRAEEGREREHPMSRVS